MKFAPSHHHRTIILLVSLGATEAAGFLQLERTSVLDREAIKLSEGSSVQLSAERSLLEWTQYIPTGISTSSGPPNPSAILSCGTQHHLFGGVLVLRANLETGPVTDMNI